MKKVIIFFFMASIMMLASCGNASTSNQVDTQNETEVITSEVSQERIVRVDRCIQSNGYSSSSYVIILTESGHYFRFTDYRNEHFSNVREGDIAHIRYFSNGTENLDNITYVIE